MEDTEQISLKIRKDLVTITVEVTTSSSDAADEKQFFLTQADNANVSEKQSPQQKNNPGKMKKNG